MSCANGAKCPSVPGHVVADYHRLNIYRPTRIYTPRTKHELVAGIIEIESSGLKAKAMGSNMSFSAVTRTDDCLIETDMLSKHLSIPHAAGNVPWTPDRFRDGVVVDRLVTMMAPPVLNKHPMLIYVEGGIKIKDLLKDLAETSSPGLALPAMGAGGAQSVAGSLATGTHGAEMDRQPLIDSIRAVHLVGPGGQEWWIERSNGFSERNRLPNSVPDWCADTRVIYDDRLFYSVLVSAGRMGVIYAMVLELEAEYWLDERRMKEPYAPVRQQLVLSAQNGFSSPMGIMNTRGAPGLMFFGVVLNLNSQAQCWVMERRIHLGSQVEVGISKGSLAVNGLCAQMPHGLLPTLLAVLSPIVLALPIVGPPLFTIVAAALTGLFVGREFVSFGEILATVLNLVPSASGALIDFALGEIEGKPPVRIGPSHRVMDQMDYDGPRDCYQGDQSEFFFNARSTQYLTFVDLLCQFAASMGGVPGYINMRFVQQSDAYIAMEQFPITVGVEVVVIRPSSNGRALLVMASTLALAMGGIPHWGKDLFGVPRSSLVLPNIPSVGFECYRFAVALTEEGRGQTFSNQFSRDSGLEPVPGASAQELDERTARNAFSVRQLLVAAQTRLAMPARPKSILQIAREFAPSLRMNADGVPLSRGKASVGGPRVRLRDLSRRIM